MAYLCPISFVYDLIHPVLVSLANRYCLVANQRIAFEDLSNLHDKALFEVSHLKADFSAQRTAYQGLLDVHDKSLSEMSNLRAFKTSLSEVVQGLLETRVDDDLVLSVFSSLAIDFKAAKDTMVGANIEGSSR